VIGREFKPQSLGDRLVGGQGQGDSVCVHLDLLIRVGGWTLTPTDSRLCGKAYGGINNGLLPSHDQNPTSADTRNAGDIVHPYFCVAHVPELDRASESVTVLGAAKQQKREGSGKDDSHSGAKFTSHINDRGERPPPTMPAEWYTSW